MLKKILIVVLYIVFLLAIRVVLGAVGLEAESSHFILGALCCLLPAVLHFVFRKKKQ